MSVELAFGAVVGACVGGRRRGRRLGRRHRLVGAVDTGVELGFGTYSKKRVRHMVVHYT